MCRRIPCACLLLLVALNTTLAAESGRPNIILMMADDMGWGDVGYQGHPHLQTPELDAMAASGLRFNRFYAAAPVCSPTRGSCLTGRHPFRYGIPSANAGHMKPKEWTVAELLKQCGYRTGHFGKWHLGTLTKTLEESNRGGPGGVRHYAPPWDHGFDVAFSTEAKVPTWDPMLKPMQAGRQWWDPVTDPERQQDYGTHYWLNGKLVTENLAGDDSRVIMDRALPFMESAAGAEQPFFAVIWFHAPHLPVVAGPQYTALYSKHGKYAQHFWGCITALDEQVGRLRRKLRELEIAENTMLCFCSDNGPEGQSGKAPGTAGELRGRKRSLLEGGVRVPGLIEWPARIPQPRQTEMPAVTSDYLPTIMDIVGASLPDDRPVDGISLLEVIDGKTELRGKSIGFESRGQLSLVADRYKILYRPAQGGGRRAAEQIEKLDFMLFDITNDPAESKDLASDEPEIVTQMKRELVKWRASCRASAAEQDY